VLALMVLQVKWLCNCYSPPNLGGAGGGYRKVLRNNKLGKNVNGTIVKTAKQLRSKSPSYETQNAKNPLPKRAECVGEDSEK